MAGIAGCRGIGVIPIDMALCTIIDIVALRKREETVVDGGRSPAGCGRMANFTICRKV